MIYLDNAATTPLSKEALEAMLPYLTEQFGNASAVYMPGQLARKAVEDSRRTIAATIHAKPAELLFTSGGSESDNWALIGVSEMAEQILRERAVRLQGTAQTGTAQHQSTAACRGHIISTAIEHHAILRTLEYLGKRGFDVTLLPVDAQGFADPAAVESAVRPDTILISVMTANNEIGTVEPVREIGAIAHAHGILFHTDAVQAYGHIPLDVSDLQADLMSASAHKLNGPKGVGFLYVRRGVQLPSFIHGGEQERGKRAGTENVAGIAGFARAAETALREMESRTETETAVRNHMIRRLLKELPGALLNGPEIDTEPAAEYADKRSIRRLPNNVSIILPGMESETMLLLLNERGIYAGAGSACASGSLEPSHVLKAIGRTHAEAYGGLRLTISHTTTRAEADQAIDAICAIAAGKR